tara:strand:+ start:4288 stop:5295 length:1008 start_codon:yes stop_codon:yes gene_type:complete
MPKRKVNRTSRAGVKGNRINRGGPTMYMAKSVARGASSASKKTLGKPMKRPRRGNRLDRSKALRSMASSMVSGMSSVGKSAYDMGMPMIEEAGRSISKAISEQKVPRVPNNGAWVDLRHGLITGLTNLGIIESDRELPTTIYFQSVEKFLENHSDIMFNADDIRSVTAKVRAMDPDDDGDKRTTKMLTIFKNGITHDSIIAVLEYEFRKQIKSSDDMEIEPEPEPGQGFQYAKEKTAIRENYMRIVSLGKSIEIMINRMMNLKKDSAEYQRLQATVNQKYETLKGFVTTDQEIQVLANIDKMLHELSSKEAKKKKSKRRKRKKTGKRGRKRTGRR